jgi:hypothetical protein
VQVFTAATFHIGGKTFGLSFAVPPICWWRRKYLAGMLIPPPPKDGPPLRGDKSFGFVAVFSGGGKHSGCGGL